MNSRITISLLSLSCLALSACNPESTGYTGESNATRYELTRIVNGAPWSFGQEAPGMAVGLDETVYLANGDTLWQVRGGVVSIYLGPAHGTFNFTDVDIDSSGLLYIFDDAHTGGQILTSSAEGTYSIHRTTGPLTFPHFMGVVDSNQIALTSREGLSIVTDTGTTLAHSETAFHGSSDCASEDLATQWNGTFSYQEGCNGTPMVLGNVDSGVPRIVRLEGDTLPATHHDSICTTRNPSGGFISVLDFTSPDTTQLVFFDDSADNTTGWEIVATSPTLDEAEASSTETFSFLFCAIAAAPSGNIYYQTYSQLWVLTPAN